MVFERKYQSKSGSSEKTTSNEIGMNVVIEDGVFQGSYDMSQVNQEPSDLENIIMEGDIILKVHDGEDNKDNTQSDFQAVSLAYIEHTKLYEHHDPTLVKVGDTFQSNKDFVQYVNENAKRWCFYYKCTEAQNVDTENEAYTYCCVYLKNRDYSKKKGSKKRYNCKTDCPCKVKLRRKPGEALTVVYVCNQHDHDLSREVFLKFQNSKKLPPYIKEIILDLLALEVETGKIRKFVEMETGMKMSRTYFYEMEKKMKFKNEERQITDKRLKELSDKMSAVVEMGSDDEDEHTDDQHPGKNKRIKLVTPAGVVCKFEEDAESARNLESSMISDPQSSWMSDQTLATSERNTTSEWDETMMPIKTECKPQHPDFTNVADGEAENDYTAVDDDYTDEYTVEETTEDTTTGTENQVGNSSQYETLVIQDEFGNIINCENDEQIVILQQDENAEHGDVGYYDGEQIVYMMNQSQQNEQSEQNEQNEINESSGDAVVQSSSDTKPGRSLVPVFDVYMKNGNVTGFVLNEKNGKEGQNVISQEGESSQDPDANTSQHSENTQEHEPIRKISSSNGTQEFMCGDVYTKHEYIHRYNIDQYMTNAQFPKFIETLAKKTRTDVMHMLTRVYNEKAMFKMTTTQKGKEGNTKIWYLTDVRRKGKYKTSDEEKMKRDQIGQYLTDILILKERVKAMKKENEELKTRNKYLEEVALRLAKMNEHN